MRQLQNTKFIYISMICGYECDISVSGGRYVISKDIA